MKLWEQRVRFTRALTTELLPAMYKAGVLPAYNWCKRCPECKVGKLGAASFHCKGLAMDIDLYDKDGNWLSSGLEHEQFAELWESLGGTAGCRFNDANHYSWGE
jgi:hypothetical protein